MNRLIVFLLILVASTTFYSQAWQGRYEQMANHFYERHYEGVVVEGKELLKELNDLGLKKDTSYVNTLYYLENTYFYLSDFANSVELGKEEVTLCKEVYGEGNYFYQQSCYLLAILATYTADYETSISNFEEVLRLMRRNGEDETPDFITIQNQLASIYDLAENVESAKEVYEDAYLKAKEYYSLEDSVMQVMTNTLSSFYLTHGMYVEAEPFFLQSLDMMEKYYGKESESYVTVLNSLGEFYLYAGWYQKCADTFLDFVNLVKKVYGPKSADYATAVNNLAVAYEKLEDFEKAEKCYLEALDIKAKVYKKESDYYALTLINLAVLYERMGKRQKAETLYTEAIDIHKNLHGAKSENYAVAISGLASLYSESGRNADAETLTLEALAIQKELFGEKYPAYITSLNNLGQIHSNMGKYKLAEKELQEVCDLRLETQGEEHPDYAISLMVLANIKSVLQNYSEAEKLFTKDLQIIEKYQGTNNSTYDNALTGLAGLYLEMGRYIESEKAFLKSLEISRNIRGEQHPEHATILNNMSQLYQEMGLYDKAEEAGLHAVEITAEAYGENDVALMYPYTILANVYKAQENYKLAEEYILRAKELAERHYPKDHPNYLNALHNLAVFYYELGNFDQAEPLYQTVAESYARIYGKEHSEYINVLNSLGAFYMSKMMYATDTLKLREYAQKSEKYFMEILKIDSSTIDLKGQDFALHLNNAGEFYRLKGEYKLAEKYYLNSISNVIDLFGKEHSSLGVNYNNLALLYDNMEEREKAMDYYEKSIAIKEKYYGAKSSSLANSYVNLASLLGQSGSLKEAYDYFEKGFDIDAYNINLNFSFLSAEEKLNYLNNSRYYVDLLNSFACEHQIEVPAVSGLMYDNELRNKGLILKSSNQLKEQVFKSKDTQLITLYDNWIAVKKELASQLSLPKEDRTINVDSLDAYSSSLEKELNRSVGHQEDGAKSWKEVKKLLKEGQAAIEFTYFYKQGEIVDPMYGALVLRKEFEQPLFVELCTEPQLIELLGEYGGNNLSYVNKVYGKLGKLNTQLYQLLWEPMMTDLKGVNEIYFAPTGLLNKVSFNAIGVGDATYLSDLYLLEQVSSTGSLGSEKNGLQIKDIALFGGARYSEEENADDIWKYLPETKTEVEQIAKLFSDMNLSEKLYVGTAATEEQFKELEKEPASIVHVATHGFFYPDLDEFESDQIEVTEVEDVEFRGGIKGYETFVKSKDPLMRSGLVFTGANNVWKESEEGQEDGVLTALEVSNLNLKGVQIMVLSACETGLGEIKGSEGVYGLQRAFKSAGVKELIMSLWQVPDKETQQFMNRFYQELLKFGDTQKAFITTQKIMKGQLDPYYWGAFVLVE